MTYRYQTPTEPNYERKVAYWRNSTSRFVFFVSCCYLLMLPAALLLMWRTRDWQWGTVIPVSVALIPFLAFAIQNRPKKTVVYERVE